MTLLKPPKRRATIKQTALLYADSFTFNALRGLIANQRKNGLQRCLYKLGKKVLIDLDAFEDWIEQQKVIKEKNQ